MSDTPDWLPEGWRAIVLVVGLGIALGILKEAIEALRADRPWFGWDLRRLRRWRDDPDRESF